MWSQASVFQTSPPKIGGGDIEKAQALQVIMADLNEGYGRLALGVLNVKAEKFAEAEIAFAPSSFHHGGGGTAAVDSSAEMSECHHSQCDRMRCDGGASTGRGVQWCLAG